MPKSFDINGVMNTRFNICFTDIDGVVSVPRSHWDLDAELMGRLNRILEATDARIVISSSWRNLFTIEQLRRMFSQHGITRRIIARTGDLNHRGNEIQEWLTENESLVRRFIVIDDDIWQLEEFEANGRMIHTNTALGLTEQEVTRAIQLLGE